MKKLILFDLDGTLLDTSEGIYSSLDYACQKLGLPLVDEYTKSKFIGPPIKKSLMINLGLSEKDADLGVSYFREDQKRTLVFSKPYDGIYTLLEKLKKSNYLLGVATLKPQVFAQIVLENHNLTKYFDVIVGADLDAKFTKSHIMKLAMNKVDIQNNDVVMIGDTASDARASQELAVDFIPVSYGFGLIDGEEQNFPHIKIANNTEDIGTIIDEL